MDDAELYFLPKQFPPGWMAHSAYMPECVRIRLVIGQGTDDVSGPPRRTDGYEPDGSFSLRRCLFSSRKSRRSLELSRSRIHCS